VLSGFWTGIRSSWPSRLSTVESARAGHPARADVQEQKVRMALVGTYRGRAVPLYGRLLVVDPSMSAVDEPDLARALEDADTAIVGGSRWRVAIKPDRTQRRLA
jgi:hypothetical protein